MTTRIGLSAILLLTVLLLGLVIGAGGVYADNPPPEVQLAAENGLPQFLATLPPAELANIGLATAEDVNAAALGVPYEQFTITPEVLAAYQPDQTLASLLSSTDTWLFPVTVRGANRTMLTVALMDGQWEAVAIGGARFAAKLEEAEEVQVVGLLAGAGEAGEAVPYTTQFLRVFQAQADFLVVEADGTEYMLPLPPVPSALGVLSGVLATPDQVLPQLNDVVQENLAADEPLLFGGSGSDGGGDGG